VAAEVLDTARLAWTEAQNQVTEANATVEKEERRLEEARLGKDRIRRKEDEVAAVRAELAKAQASMKQRKASRLKAEAALEEVQCKLRDLVIKAPSTGVVVSRMVEPGEVVMPGEPLYDLINLDRLYLKAYVAETDVGKVRRGLEARIYSDAFPDHPYPATVRYIASKAEFTPKEVQTPEQRVKLAFAVKLYLEENPDHQLTPGLPVDAVIRWKSDVPWSKPRW
jgi:HlyD family secretion protein